MVVKNLASFVNAGKQQPPRTPLFLQDNVQTHVSMEGATGSNGQLSNLWVQQKLCHVGTAEPNPKLHVPSCVVVGIFSVLVLGVYGEPHQP